jgi:predicted RNA-binding Zn-ribbon protein involved in translation (DUF1610 family)
VSERDSEQLIGTFREDELAKQSATDVQGAYGRTSKPRRRSNGGDSLPTYRPGRGSGNPFRCSACGNPQIRAFATMYSQGTSTAVSLKGFIFKHAYQKTWRQTEIAKICAPPQKKKLWPALLLIMLAAGGIFAVSTDFMSASLNSRVTVACFLLGWLGFYLVAYHFYWNLRHYPQRMNEYGRLHYCPRCGTVTTV